MSEEEDLCSSTGEVTREFVPAADKMGSMDG